MPHYVLKGFRVHSSFGHVWTEGVPAGMRSDFRELLSVSWIVFACSVSKIMFPVKGVGDISVFVQKNEMCLSIYYRLLVWMCSLSEYFPEAIFDIRWHWDNASPFFSLRFFDTIAVLPVFIQLMVYYQTVSFEVNIADCQSAELGNAQTGVK